MPLIVSAQGFLGPIIPSVSDENGNLQTCAAGWQAFVIVLAGLVKFAVSVGIVIAVMVIVYAGALFVFSATNPESISKGKKILANAVVGLLIALASWLIVNTILLALGVSGGVIGSTSILGGSGGTICIKTEQYAAKPTTGGGISIGGPGGGGGICTVQSQGACAESNFVALFGSAAGEASQICYAESANGTLLEGDKTTEGNPVSFGLFQINTTVHKVAGLDCPSAYDSAFTGRHHNVKIVNRSLYEQCRAAALIASNSAQVAHRIYSGDNGSWRQWSTRAKCGLSIHNPDALALKSTSPFNLITVAP